LMEQFNSGERSAELIEQAESLMYRIHSGEGEKSDEKGLFDWGSIMLFFAAMTGVQPPATWNHAQLEKGDNMCYFTLVSVPLLGSACGKQTAPIAAGTVLTPTYTYTQSSTCAQFSAIPVADQKARFDANEAARKTANPTTYKPRQFNKVIPFRYEWYAQVTSGSTTGFVSVDRVVKIRCDQSAVTCPFTPINPTTCYRVSASTPIMSAPCGTAVQNNGAALVALTQDILVTSDSTAVATPSSCQGTWLHITFTGIDGYALSTTSTQFACNGDGWLDKVGPFNVIKMDHSRDTNGNPLTGPMATAPNKFLLHTIEGAWPANGDYPNGALDSFKYWPNFIVARQSNGVIAVAQYFSIYSSSRALSHNNNAGVVQVEIGARADNPFTEQDWVLALTVRELYRAVAAVTGIPICKDSRVNFIDNHSPSARLSTSDFLDVHGICGHQHVPGESHWDPGQIDSSKLID